MQNSCDSQIIKQKSPYNQYTADRQAEACRVFTEDWDELLEKLLIKGGVVNKHFKPKQLESQICDEETKACKDIDESKWKRTRFYLDGVEQIDTKVT